MVGTLFDIPRTHRADPLTSYEAAERAAPKRPWWYREVYRALRDHDDPEYGNTAKSIASRIAERTGRNYFECYHYVQRVLSEMERCHWIFRKEIRSRKCCPWWCYQSKESEVGL